MIFASSLVGEVSTNIDPYDWGNLTSEKKEGLDLNDFKSLKFVSHLVSTYCSRTHVTTGTVSLKPALSRDEKSGIASSGVVKTHTPHTHTQSIKRPFCSILLPRTESQFTYLAGREIKYMVYCGWSRNSQLLQLFTVLVIIWYFWLG